MGERINMTMEDEMRDRFEAWRAKQYEETGRIPTLCDSARIIPQRKSPPMKQINRVTEAIYNVDPVLDAKGNPVPWNKVFTTVQGDYISQARAAIAAMWTPFDAEDESTWPEKHGVYLVRFPFNKFWAWQWSGQLMYWHDAICYQEIGESE